MQLTIRVKQAGKKQALIGNKVIDIEDIGPAPSVKTLITAVVAQQVQEFNSKPFEKSLLPFLDNTRIDEQATSGKVGFNTIYNNNKADLPAAQQTALLAFEDGIFALFADEEELPSLETIINLTPDTVITFIRLTFLAGSYW